MTNHPDWAIDSAALKEIMGKVVLLDVREPEEYVESHLEGSVLIPLGELQLRAEKELQKDADIVVYCAAGIRSLQGMMALRMLGFQKTRSLEGGLHAWEDLGFPTQKGM